MESLFSGNLTHLMGQPLTVDASHCCDDMFRALCLRDIIDHHQAFRY